MQARQDDNDVKKYLQVEKGQFTFDVEGKEGGPYHSRVAHYPGGRSGVTIGRGYDMGAKEADKIIRDLTAAGLDKASAEKFAKCAGKTGEAAKKYIAETAKSKEEALPEISLAVQHALFRLTYNELMADMKRILKKHDIDFDALDALMQDILVDLRYQGDYHDNIEGKLLRPSMKNNDLNEFIKQIEDDNNWPKVNGTRMKERKKYCANKKPQQASAASAAAAASSSSVTGSSLFKPAAKPVGAKSTSAAVKPR